MTDEELVAAFREVLRARQPPGPSASSPGGPLSSLQQLPAKIQGLKLNWPWQQQTPPAGGSDAKGVSEPLQDASVGNELAPARSKDPQASIVSPPEPRGIPEGIGLASEARQEAIGHSPETLPPSSQAQTSPDEHMGRAKPVGDGPSAGIPKQEEASTFPPSSKGLAGKPSVLRIYSWLCCKSAS